MKSLSIQGIAKATIINALARALAGFLKLLVIILIARDFGAGLVVDAYMIAKSVPFLFLMIGEATLITSFLPIFLDYRVKKGENQAWLLADSVFTFVLIFLSVVLIVVLLFAPTVTSALAPGLPDETLSLGASLLRMMSPVIVLAGICSMGACVFYSYQHFTVPAIGSLFFPLGMIVAIVITGDTIGIVAVPIGAVVGSVAQATTLMVVLVKKKRWFRPKLNFRCPGFAETIASIVPRLVAFVVNRLNVIVDRVFASALGAGYISALSYADRVVQISVMLFTNPFVKAAMPVLCRLHAGRDVDHMRRLFHKMTGMLFFVTIPVSIILILFGQTIIGILLQRGAFDMHAGELTTYALIFYGIGLLPFSMTIVLSVFFYALNDAMTPMKAALVCFVLNTALDAVLVRVLEHGGLALATSLVAVVSSGLLFWLLGKKIGPFDLRETVISFAKIFAAATVMGAIMWGALAYFESAGPCSNSLVHFGLALCLGFVMYMAACHLLRVNEQALILEALSKRFRLGRT